MSRKHQAMSQRFTRHEEQKRERRRAERETREATQERLDDATRDANVLGFALSTSPESARLHMVAGDIAHVWQRHGVPLAMGLECVRNALCHFTSDIGITHALHDAVTYRRSSPALYPEWQSISISTVRLTVLALGVWCTKGWRR